jgi:peptide/nickel transport system permease protein
MAYYILKRFAVALAVLVAVSVATFALLRLAGDPAIALAGADASQQDIEAVRVAYGFDRPLVVQYLTWAGRALTGDFGMSVYLKRPVAEVLVERAPVTLILAACALAFALLLGIPLGVLAAVHRNTAIDRLALTVAVIGQALPNFFFALILIYTFGMTLRLLPISGDATWWHYVLPAVALGYYASPAIMRLTRAGMIEVLSSDYIRTARAKGLFWRTVLFKHALRNAIIPVVSLTAVQLGLMLSGSIVVESVFSMNGLGRLGWQSIQRADIEMMQALVLTVSVFYLVLTFLADIFNAFLDPRIRLV